ncbi:ATP-binding protein [Phaeacidiphilus oryzae]|uniref:ATP-binding protein n=1 Tax=Phaeacidiphilus oryzae TaxID=348818 RepID=UPI00069218A6|nr:ATP-binding protein [Phaeacidiphilus oryzae]
MPLARPNPTPPPRAHVRRVTAPKHPFVDVVATPGEIGPKARRQLFTLATAWLLPMTAEALADAQLVADELVANALTHACPDSPCELALMWTGRSLRIEVADGSTLPPTAGVPPDEESTSGRGLLLVQALTERWGCASRDAGKIVWAEVAPSDETDPDVTHRALVRAVPEHFTAAVTSRP